MIGRQRASPRRVIAERLDARGLRHAADPRRPPAAEEEVVLPPERVSATGHERDHLVEEPAQPLLLVARRPQAVGLAEGAQRLDLDALAGVVLEDDLRARELDAAAWRGQGPRAGPQLAVADEGEREGRNAGGGESAILDHPVQGREDRSQLARALPPELPKRALGSVVGAPRPVVGRLVDPAGGEVGAKLALEGSLLLLGLARGGAGVAGGAGSGAGSRTNGDRRGRRGKRRVRRDD